MRSGLAADRNRRPPNALLLAERCRRSPNRWTQLASQPGTGRKRDDPSVARRSHRGPARLRGGAASYCTRSVILPTTLSSHAGLRASQTVPLPGRFAGIPALPLTTRASEALTPSRPVSYYILLGLSALALFAISMFLTILVLS